MYDELKKINERPSPFAVYTAADLWTDEHTSSKMLEYHLNEDVNLSSRTGAFIDKSVEWIASRFAVGQQTAIADFGCGPGLYTTALAERGASVTGIDFSARSIEYASETARSKGLQIEYVQQNYLEFETDKAFDLITMIFCDFCALSPEQRKTLLTKFRALLKPGGSLLMDVHTVNIFNSREELSVCEHNQLDGFWSPDDYYAFLNIFKYEEELLTLDKYTIFEKDRTRVVYNWLQYFTQDSLREEFAENGLEIEAFYSDVAGAEFSSESADMAVVAKGI